MPFAWTGQDRYLNFGALKLPVRRGLVGAYVLGGSAEQSVKNLVPGRAPGALVGDVEIHDNFIRFNGPNGYLNTFLPDSASGTIAALVRSADNVAPALVGGVQGGGDRGANLYIVDSGGYRANMWQTLTPGGAKSIYSGNNRAIGAWSLMVATYSDFLIKLWDRTGDGLGGGVDPGGMAGGTPSGVQLRFSNRTFCIGGAPGTSFLGRVDIAQLYKFEVDLTDDEIIATADGFMRPLAADYAIAA